MTSEEKDIEMLIISDDQGNHYILTDEILAACRISDEMKATVDTLIGSPDVAGYVAGRYRATSFRGPTSGFGGGKSGELSMMQLQSLLAQRQQAVQLSTNLMSSTNDSNKGISGNLGR